VQSLDIHDRYLNHSSRSLLVEIIPGSDSFDVGILTQLLWGMGIMKGILSVCTSSALREGATT